jgi:formate dehydrogenase gamma subunit
MKIVINKILRHKPLVRAVHWMTAISTFILIFSGIGQMPMYKRYMLSELPGLAWTADYQATLILHYIAATVLVLTAIFHLVYHVSLKEFTIVPKRGDVKESFLIIKAMFGFGEEPPSGKYLAEQRLAYAYIAFSLFLIIVTGIIKVIKNFAAFSISEATMIWVTLIHNIGMIMIMLGIFLHLAAFIFKENRALVPSMFTGYISEDYIKHRHNIWYKELEQSNKIIKQNNEELKQSNEEQANNNSAM